MKLKMLGLAASAAMALTAFAAPAASATTLEVGGVAKNSAVAISASLKSGTSSVWATTATNFIANTCTVSSMGGTTSVFTGATVSAPLSTLSFSSCTEEPVTVDTKGSLTVERIGSTTNGTVRSADTRVTVPSPFGPLACVTGTGTDIGTLTGVASGNATIHINAVINCGILLPSALWEATYTVTSPSGLGVTG